MKLLAKALTLVSALALVGSITGATSTPSSAPLVLGSATAESVKLSLVSLAKTTGFYEDLSYWSTKNGRLEIGLEQIRGDEAQIIQNALRVPVSVVSSPKFYPNYKFVAAKPGALKTGVIPPLTDNQPFQGGDRIWRYAGNGYILCTAGGTYLKGGVKVMLTSGHCGPTGSVWQQGYIGSDGTPYRTGYMGTTSEVQWGDGRIDAGIMNGGSIQARVWVSSTVSYPVSGPAAVGMGQIVCFDGSVTGYSCDARVTAINTCVAYGPGQGNPATDVCGVNVAESPHVISQHGDSGGPVLNIVSNSVKLAGIISGADKTGNRGVFVSASTLLNNLGVVPATQ